MSIALMFFILAMISFLMAASAIPSRIQWFPLGWAFVIAAVISGNVFLR